MTALVQVVWMGWPALRVSVSGRSRGRRSRKDLHPPRGPRDQECLPHCRSPGATGSVCARRKRHSLWIRIPLHVAQFIILSKRIPAMMVRFSHQALLRAREQGRSLEEIDGVPASGDPVPANACLEEPRPQPTPAGEIRAGRLTHGTAASGLYGFSSLRDWLSARRSGSLHEEVHAGSLYYRIILSS